MTASADKAWLVAIALIAAGCSTTAPPAAAPATAPGGGGLAPFLKAYGLGRRPVLVEVGSAGCARTRECLTEITALHALDAVPGLSYAYVEADALVPPVDPATHPFPVIADPERAFANALGAFVYPQVVLVDTFGNVRYRGKLPERAALYTWFTALDEETRDPGPDVVLFGAATLDAPALLVRTALPRLGGGEARLSDFAGRGGTLLVFVDTSCPFASEAIDDMHEIAGSLVKHGVGSALISIGDALEDVTSRFGAVGATVPVVYDSGTSTQVVWHIESVPTVLLISSAGHVAYNGGAVWADVAAAAVEMLELTAGAITFEARGTEYG